MTPTALKRTFGERLQRWRKREGLTLPQLAAKAKLSKGLLSKIEGGAGNPCLTTLKALAVALRIEICIKPHE